jgi:hypothetical protein
MTKTAGTTAKASTVQLLLLECRLRPSIIALTSLLRTKSLSRFGHSSLFRQLQSSLLRAVDADVDVVEDTEGERLWRKGEIEDNVWERGLIPWVRGESRGWDGGGGVFVVVESCGVVGVVGVTGSGSGMLISVYSGPS